MMHAVSFFLCYCARLNENFFHLFNEYLLKSYYDIGIIPGADMQP